MGDEDVLLQPGEDRQLAMDLSGTVVFGRIERRGKPAACDISLRRTQNFVSRVAHSGRSGDSGAFAMLVSEPDVYTAELNCVRPRLRTTIPQLRVPLDGKELRIAIPDAHVSGLVVDRSGQPLRGFGVQARQQVRIEAGSDRERGAEVMALGGPTDETSAFVLEGLAPGRWALNAASEGRRRSAVREVDLGDGETLATVLLRVESGVRLAGRVLASDGRPVGNARLRVAVALPGTAQVGELVSIATDAKGRFEHDLGPGAGDVVNIAVSARDLPAAAFRVPASEGLVLTVPSQGGALEIEGPRGESVAWARPLILVNEAGAFVLLDGDVESSGTTVPVTGASPLTVRGLAPGVWGLARMDDRGSALVALSGGGSEQRVRSHE